MKARLFYTHSFLPVFICLTAGLVSTPLKAQGIVDMVVPHTGVNAETAAYHARVRDQIAEMLRNWGELMQRKDSTALASIYTANARSVIGRVPEGVTPRAVVKQLLGTTLAGSHVDITIQDFDMSGDMAFVSAVLIAPSSPSDPAPVFAQSLFVLRFDDWRERWQIREQFIDWREPSRGGPESESRRAGDIDN